MQDLCRIWFLIYIGCRHAEHGPAMDAAGALLADDADANAVPTQAAMDEELKFLLKQLSLISQRMQQEG